MKKYWKIIIGIVIVALFTYKYFAEKNGNSLISVQTFTKQEQLEIKIEELQEKILNFKEENDHLNGQLEDLKQKYKDDEELIELLRDQLNSYGIEPYEL